MSRDSPASLTTMPPTSGERPSVQGRALLFVVAFAVVTGGILAGMLFFLRADAIRSGGKVLSAFAQLTGEQTTRTIQNVDEALQEAAALLSASTEAGAANKRPMQLAFQRILESRPFLRAIVVLSEEGRVVYSS